MYTDQINRSAPPIDFTAVSAGICIVCGLVEVGLFCAGAPGASMLTVAVAEVGAIAALAYRMTLRRAGFAATRAKRRAVGVDALTKGERAVLARLRFRSIAVVKQGDEWRPAGSLPHAATLADFHSLLRDNFVFIDMKRGLLFRAH